MYHSHPKDTFDVAVDRDTEDANPGLFNIAFAFEETLSYGS